MLTHRVGVKLFSVLLLQDSNQLLQTLKRERETENNEEKKLGKKMSLC